MMLMLVKRDQQPERRPDFTEVVDELLEIEKEKPESKFTEVRTERIKLKILYSLLAC
jgi:hypothetical protein